jgi:hypothetical protein
MTGNQAFFGGGCFAVFGRDVAVSARVLWEQPGMPWIGTRLTGSKGDPPPPGPHEGVESPLQIDAVAGATVIGDGRERARLGGAGFFTNADGILFAVDSVSQSWVLAACMSCLHTPSTAYAHGPLPPAATRIELNSWHTLRLEVSGTSATGTLDGHTLFSKVKVGGNSHQCRSGYVGIGLGNFTAALFDDFSVEAAAT